MQDEFTREMLKTIERKEGDEDIFEESDEEIVSRSLDGVGDIVQMTIEEMLYAFSEAISREVSTAPSEPLRTLEFRDVVDRIRTRVPEMTDRVMMRVAKGEEPFAQRRKENNEGS